MELFLVRHAESIWNAEARWQGQTDIPLSEGGRREVQRIAERLAADRFHRIVSSDLSRAHDTAIAIARGREVEPEPALREMNLGEWCGLPHAEVAARFGDQLHAFASGLPLRIGGDGETLDELDARVWGALDRIVRGAGQDERVLVVSHGGVIRSIVMRLLSLRGRARPLVGVSNTSITTLVTDAPERGPEALRVQVYNDDLHLDPRPHASDERVLGASAHRAVAQHLELAEPALTALAPASDDSVTDLAHGKERQLRRYAVRAPSHA